MIIDKTTGKIYRVVRFLVDYQMPYVSKYSIEKVQEFDDRECVICYVFKSEDEYDVMVAKHYPMTPHKLIFPTSYLELTNDEIVKDMFNSLDAHYETIYNIRKSKFDELVKLGLTADEHLDYEFESLYPDNLLSTSLHILKRFNRNKK
jgi:hypothetical protein